MSLLSIYQEAADQAGTWKAITGTDPYGFPEYGDPVPIDLIFSRHQKLIKNASGDEVLSAAQALVSEAVGLGDLINYNGTEYEVKAIDDAPPIITSDVMRTLYF